MTTYYHFAPSRKQAPAFMPTFDGAQYMVTVPWNVSGQRFYVKCLTINGRLVFNVPLVESTPPIEIESLDWDPFNKRVVVTTVDPHELPLGRVMNITVKRAFPTTYNGNGFASILNRTQFEYPLIQDPGQPTLMGTVEYLINMIKPYFQSTLIFRNRMFEVNP
jgi:hypothetical protein